VRSSSEVTGTSASVSQDLETIQISQHAGQERDKLLVGVQREDVRDVLVRADDDPAASLADHAAQVEDGGARHLLNGEEASGVVTVRINGHPITLFERGIVVPEGAPGYLLKGGGPGRRAVGIAALRYRTT
jgi:hypothetical protein